MSTLPIPGPAHTYGWRRPLPGRGALDLLPRVDVSGITILPEVDPRPHMPAVFNQGQLGSCTANATAACFQYDAIQAGHDSGELSRLWIYYFERALEHTLGQGDTGAMGHDAFTVAKHGVPDESLWPYVIGRFEEKPPACEPRAYTLTRPVHALGWTEEEFKAALSAGQTVAIGFTVYESFEEGWDRDGVMPAPDPRERVLGGHEVLVVGYLKDMPEYALVRNSWGPEWALGGYFLMPWSFLLNPNYASDFRTIVRPA